MEKNFLLDLMSTLDQAKSRKQINDDIRQLENTINKLRITGTFARGNTKQELNAYIKSLQAQLNHVKLSAKIDDKNLKREIEGALNKVSFKDIDLLKFDGSKTKLKMQKVIADTKAYVEKNPVSIGINYEIRRNKLDNDLTAYLKRNTKIEESSVLLKEADRVRTLIGAINDKKSLREATDAFQLYKSSVASVGFNTKSTTDKIKDMFGHITKLGSLFSVTSLAVNNFTKSLGTLKDIDDILTEISKTSNLTAQELERLGDTSFKSASKYGKTASDYLTGIQEMSRSGFYGEKGTAMAEQSLLAQAAGDISADVANKYILATNAAYKFNGEAEKLNAVLDGQNNITNRNSVALSDMATAMSEAGTVASSYRVSIEDLSAMIGTMESVTKLGGSEVGNGIKAILINLQNVNSSKITDTLDAANASMTEFVNGTEKLRDPISILRDLAETFNKLGEDDALRAEILTNIGGKHQAAKLAALLQNMEMFDKMLVDYSEGSGSAMEEAMKSANNWSGKLNQLQNSWDSLVSSITNKDTVLSGLTFGDKLIQGVESFIDTFGEIPVLLTTINTAMTAMKKDYGITQLVNPETKKLDVQGNLMGIDISRIKNLKKHYNEAEIAIAKWNSRLAAGKVDINDFDDALVKNSAQFKAYLQTTSKDAPASLSGYKAHLNAAGISTDALRLKTILLNSAISMGIGIAIQAAVQGIAYLIQREENLRQATEEAANAYKESTSSIEDYTSRYEELHKALIAAKGNEEETYNIKKQLLDLQIELNDTFGDEYGKLNLLTDAYKDQTEAIKEYNKEAANTYLNENQKGIENAVKEITGKRNYNLGGANDLDNNDKWVSVKDIALKYQDKGIDIVSSEYDGSLSIQLTADAQSAYDIINEFESELRSKAKELGDEHIFDDILAISSSELNNAKETLDKYGDIYKQALMADLVSSDDKSDIYNDAIDAVEKYNEAVLKSEDPFSDEKVKNARQSLKAVQDEIKNDDSWQKYGSIIDEVFEQADTRLYDFNEDLKTDSSLQEYVNGLTGLDDVDLKSLNPGENESFDRLRESADEYGVSIDELIDSLVRLGYVQGEIQGTLLVDEAPALTFENAWADSFTSENDKVRELGDTLLGLAEKGRLTKETFKEADSTAGGYFKNLGISADEAVSKINKLVDESSQLSSMSSQLSSMAEALGTKQENGFVEADTLAGFDVEVRGLDSWDRFQEVLGSTTSSYEECQEAANALATEWVNSSDFLAQLTEQNEEYYKTQLESMGIENYEEVISYAHALNEAKEVLSQSSLELGNATYDEIEALIAEGQYSELTANMILTLYDAKIAEQAATLDTSTDCANLIALANDTDRTSQSIQLLIQLMDIYSGLESGAYNGNRLLREEALAEVNRIKKELEALANGETDGIDIEPTVKLGNRGKSSAKSAGKSAGKSLKDGLKEELSDLESVISGITGRIDDQISSVNEQKSAALESIDAQKEAIESAKESAVAALEEERQKRLEVIETQKDQLQEQIKLIEKQIKSKQDEIDRINEAAEARAREISLQEKQYALEQKRNQRTKLVYTESSGIIYRPDEQGIRKAKEEVDDAKRQIEIANIQKEIDLLEDQKDLLNEQIDLLDEQADAVNKYYEEQISQTEKYYDNLLKNLEKQRKETEAFYSSLTKSLEQRKEKFQELTEILEKAELSAKLKQLGIDEEALLNGSEEEFNKLKDAYMSIVFQLNEGNDEVLNKLRELSGYEGTAPTMLEESNTKLGTMNDELGNANTEVGNVNSSLTKTASTTSDVATNVSDVNTNIGETVGLVNNEKGAFDELKQTIDLIVEAINQKIQAIETGQSTVASAVGSEMANFQLLINKILEVKEKLDAVNDTVATMDRQPIDNLASAFQLLYDKLLLVSNLLGVGVEGEGTVNGISGAIQALNEISLEEGIIAQFTNLKTAIDSVTAAISGGGGESSEGSGSGGASVSKGSKQGGAGGKGSEGKGESGGGGNSLTGAIESMGETAKEVIGEPDAEGDGTVIGEFGSMETAVNDVRDAIGTGDSEGSTGSSKASEGDGTLIGSIEDLGEKTLEEMGESGGDGVIGRFEEFRDVISKADEHIKSISDGLDDIDGKEVSCTIHVNIETTGSTGFTGSAQVLGSMNLDSADYHAQYTGNAHYEGTAEVTGDWGVKKGGTTLVGELGQELVVFPNGRFKTVGDNGAEFTNIPAGSIVFNHLQTKELLSKGNIVGRGRGRALASGTALANGTVNNSSKQIPVSQVPSEMPMWERMEKCAAALGRTMEDMLNPLNSLALDIRKETGMGRYLESISNVNNVTNNNSKPSINIGDIHVTCPGVTEQQVAERIGGVLV